MDEPVQQQLNQASECNVAGMVIVNPDTRVATITVEVYYTGNSAVDENYLTVAMLQDSILGSNRRAWQLQSAQVVGNQYCHMHILRDVINHECLGRCHLSHHPRHADYTHLRVSDS